jgi:hypothetical protein
MSKITIDYEAKQFDMDTVAKAARCPFPTLASWRLRGGLFKDTVTGTKHSKFFSLTDVCVARTVRVLTTEFGLGTADAISVADFDFRLEFTMAFEDGATASRFVGIHRDKRTNKLALCMLKGTATLDEMKKRMLRGPVTIIDVLDIIDDVFAALKLERVKS